MLTKYKYQSKTLIMFNQEDFSSLKDYFTRRALAFIFDLLLFYLFFFFFAGVALGIYGIFEPIENWQNNSILRNFIVVSMILFKVLYEVLNFVFLGKSLGKHLYGLKIFPSEYTLSKNDSLQTKSKQFHEISYLSLVTREVVKTAIFFFGNTFIILAELVVSLLSQKKRTFVDGIADTRVLLTSQKPKRQTNLYMLLLAIPYLFLVTLLFLSI